MGSKQKTRLKDVYKKLHDKIYSPKRVAVLGAFDTWPCIDYVSRHLAKMGYTAVTSRCQYVRDGKEVKVREQKPQKNETMIDFLYRFIISCKKAVVLYSVPAGHYIETHWCQAGKVDTLGIALVRQISTSKDCGSLKTAKRNHYSICRSNGDAWGCIKKGNCPFKEQGIAKNVIEYYLPFKKTPLMRLVALDNLDNVPDLLKKWLNHNI